VLLSVSNKYILCVKCKVSLSLSPALHRHSLSRHLGREINLRFPRRSDDIFESRGARQREKFNSAGARWFNPPGVGRLVRRAEYLHRLAEKFWLAMSWIYHSNTLKHGLSLHPIYTRRIMQGSGEERQSLSKQSLWFAEHQML
jgi:hypothetical protein